MIKVTSGVWRRYDEQLDGANVPSGEKADYRKWLRYYLDFCHKYGHAYAASDSLPPFLEKLASKRQGDAQRGQAGQAVGLYHRMLAESATGEQPGRGAAADVAQSDVPGKTAPSRATQGSRGETDDPRAASWREQYQAMRDQIQIRNYSPRTLNTYTHWTRRFQSFMRSKPPEVLDTEDVKAFLTDLAVREHVSASTQNQAFNALIFFYRNALGKEFGKVDGVVRAKRRPYIPVVLSRDEVDAVIAELEPPYDLIVKLLYGCGLRISECTELRVHCFNLAEKLLTVHDGKGQKDRTVPLPELLMPELRDHLDMLRELHRRDLATAGYAGVFLPRQYEKKAKHAAREFVWQWFFPAPRLTRASGTKEYRRYHVQRSHVHKAIKRAAGKAALTKRVTAHTFRHSFASHLLQANYDIVTIQRLLGHSNVKTTMIYTQTVPSITLKDAKSPLDL